MFRVISILVVILGTVFVLGKISMSTIESQPIPRFSETIATSTPQPEYTIPLKTPSGLFRVFVASTTEQLERGLSYREPLPDDRGMLFIFGTVSKPGFWMKDMNFPIDIVWIGSNKKIIGIERNVGIESYPQLYFPPANIKYVLEINAGNSTAWGMKVGTVLHF